MTQQDLERLKAHYFDCPERKVWIAANKVLLEQHETNRRLYYVRSGKLDGYVRDEQEELVIRVFTAEAGAFIGVYSFFSGTQKASSTVIARENSELAWVDLDTKPAEPDVYGPLLTQFTPVIVNELYQRQMSTMHEAIAKERALQKLYTAEQMTTLGQLAAGIAHELNNAVGVLNSKTERMQVVIEDLLDTVHPDARMFFQQGLRQGQALSSAEVRNRARKLESQLELSKEAARALARAVPKGDIPEPWMKQAENAVKFWEIGRDLRDIHLAARHSVGIVKSVKQLGRTDPETKELLDINESIHKAISLLQSDLRRVSVHLSPATLPKFRGSSTELVQIWANIIKNACDAMADGPEPEIEITTRHTNKRILVTIANNGPEIDEMTRRRMFQPDFTTKKGGLSFGLGLGLSIVKRIISGYAGSIAVKSSAEKTIFRIKLPIED
ncbi:histidine kinase [Vibrio albus]|uniref:histidine kinase n=1 Tax=Vibrio albus TaxID=2200953 RepID=A0A2U3BDW5_9VIBR|nr:ATP-binding protein [Vibrio albus]PWI34967.1 histidine kinase [Vibrio albus]